jgi:alkylation response protein AidB-like acyl-CoA dehydrogenase
LIVSLLEPANLPPRQARFLELAAQLAVNHASRADVFDRSNTVPLKSFDELRASGYPALTVPERFGGMGANLLEFVMAQSRLAMGDASVALTAAMNAHVLGSAAQTNAWPEALLERVCRDVVTGKIVNAVASEPELGSPSRGGRFQTVAYKVEGGWELHGRKTWATGGQATDCWVVHAALDGKNLASNVGKMVVDARANGVRLEETWQDALSLRASAAHDVVFEGVFVPDFDFIPSGTGDLTSGPTSSAWFWGAMSATYLGVGLAALEATARYARERTPTALGAPIATLDGVQHKIGEMELALHAAQTVLFDAARHWSDNPEMGESLMPLMAGAKLMCTNAAIRATDLSLRAAGGASLTRALSLERHFRDARAGLAHPPSDELALQMIGKARLGIK